jgi:hypothetical protein
LTIQVLVMFSSMVAKAVSIGPTVWLVDKGLGSSGEIST